MEPEQAIYQKLAGTAAITALVSTRIYPNEADPDAHLAGPIIVYGITASQDLMDLNAITAFVRSELSVLTVGLNFDTVKAVAGAIKTALHKQAFTGVLKAYLSDYSTAETEDGFEALQTFTVWQAG